ncbi:MAG TPA: hypothetical protein PKY87_16680, partial [Terricaulis sp.]|nr:hypothetical protein [Terricaulis sp.]
MCVQCAVQTPVGYRCKECVRGIQSKYFNANPYDDLIALGLAGVQIINPAPGVGDQNSERRRLALKRIQAQHERQVLEHVGVVAHMEGVSIIHSAPLTRCGPKRQEPR